MKLAILLPYILSELQIERLAAYREALGELGVEVCLGASEGSVKVGEVDFFWKDNEQSSALLEQGCEAVLFFSTWRHFALSADFSIPVAFDISQPEFYSTGHEASFGIKTKLQALSCASHLVVSVQKYKFYLSGWLLQAGVMPRGRDFFSILETSQISSSTLREFVRALSLESKEESNFQRVDMPAYGQVAPMHSPWSAVSKYCSVEDDLRSEVSFIMPEENILKFGFYIEKACAAIRYKFSSKKRGTIVSGVIEPPSAGLQLVEVPRFNSPSGGEEVDFSVSSLEAFRLGFSEPAYPYLSEEKALVPSLYFLSGSATGFSKIKILFRRALVLLIRGDWKRLYVAIKRRVFRISRLG